jgi:hypothetical protein
MPEEEPSINSFDFITRAEAGYDPFGEDDHLKFVRISGVVLAQLAEKKGIKLDEQLMEDGVILFGFEAERHYEFVSDNLNIDTKFARDKIGYADAGYVAKLVDGEVGVHGTSGDLNDEDGESYFTMSSKDPHELEAKHSETTDLLNEIYKGSQFGYRFSVFSKS